MFGEVEPALTDLRFTVARALNHTVDALSATSSARAPMHRDAPQAEHLELAAGHLEDARIHLQEARR